MTAMTDPSDGLVSFQQALLDDDLDGLMPASLHPDVKVMLDMPNGVARFTYALIEDETVTAIAMLVATEPLDRIACFQIGYAVAKPYRGKGLAKKIAKASIDELKNGLKRNGLLEFYVEAVVGVTNIASKKVAEAIISSNSKRIIDDISGCEAVQYLKLVS